MSIAAPAPELPDGDGPRRPSYAELREQIRVARAERTLRRLEHEARLEEHYFGYTGLSDFVDPSDAFRDPDLRGFSSPYLPAGAGRRDREDGRNRPFVWMDLDLDWIRSQARWVATKNPLGLGILRRLTNFTIRKGYTYEAKPAEELAEDPGAMDLARQVDRVIKEFRDLNLWAQRERSIFRRSRRDGEVFVRSFCQDNGTTLVRFVEPEQVRQPVGSPANWLLGVHTDPDDIELVYSYAVHYHSPDDWCEVPAEEVSHLRLNVDECVKRGLSDFYATGAALDETWKLLRNLRVVGCVQSAIPWIEQFESASSTQVQAYVEAKRDSQRPQLAANPITGRPTNYRRYEPGEIPHVGKGKTYVPQPPAANVPNHVAVVQAGLRSIGQIWDMPEYMVSGDASNANYASTLVAGSPFVTAIECEQDVYATYFLRIIWIAIRNAANAGRLRLSGRPVGPEEVERMVDVHVTPPQVAIANKREEADVDHRDIAAGVMSLQTRRAKVGLKDEKERQNLKEEPPTRIAGKAQDLDARGNPVDGSTQTKPGDSPGRLDTGLGDPLARMFGESLTEIEPSRAAVLRDWAKQITESEKRSEGEVWQGESGRWFTLHQGHVVPAKAPGSGRGRLDAGEKAPGGQMRGQGGASEVPDAARPDLTTEESAAVADYAEDGYHEVNRALRGLQPETEQTKRLHGLLTSAMAKVKPFAEPVQVVSGRQVPGSVLGEFVGRIQAARDKGEPITFPGYMSTSVGDKLDSDFADATVVFRIQARKGLDVGPHTKLRGAESERELLLPANSKHMVKGVRKRDDGVWEVDLEQTVEADAPKKGGGFLSRLFGRKESLDGFLQAGSEPSVSQMQEAGTGKQRVGKSRDGDGR